MTHAAARAIAHVVALLGLVLWAGACVSVQWSRDRSEHPIPGATIRSLVPGETDLAAVLATLGAPIVVREHKLDGVQLAYGWSEQDDWGVDVSIPIDNYSASLNYAQAERELEGVLLLFDADLLLVTVRRGHLRDLLRGDGGTPPALVEPREDA